MAAQEEVLAAILRPSSGTAQDSTGGEWMDCGKIHESQVVDSANT
jgi:hypothetical protein